MPKVRIGCLSVQAKARSTAWAIAINQVMSSPVKFCRCGLFAQFEHYQFLLSHPNLRFPANPKYYSANQGNEKYWSAGVQRYTRWLQGLDPEQPRKELSGRHIGSLVADFHRNLLDGGVYYYPADSQNPAKPHGKLRLMVEAIPLSYIAEQAGGRGSDGGQDILDIQPESLHQRTPLFIGHRELVDKAEAYIRRWDAQ
jgi:fructose-1,6-bisphosphatase I